MRFLLADKVFDGEQYLPEKTVLVVNENSLEDVVDLDELDSLKVETLKGVITPGFINAHCHLELSHLKGVIPQRTGLPEFGMQIMAKRNAASNQEIQQAMIEADKQMWKNGIVATADISNSSDSFPVKTNSKVRYHTFIELLGLHPDRVLSALENGEKLLNECTKLFLSASLAPHAPYSTSLELIKEISLRNTSESLPSSIHNEESEDEMKFFRGEVSGFDKLYASLKIDVSFFKAPMCSSLEHYIKSIGKQKTLLVHNTFTSKEDIGLTKGKNTLWCFCPNANLYIEERLPDFSLFAEDFCVGTDSLASNYQLDLINEANIILKNSTYSIEKILKSITSVPAGFLGFNDLGKISKGKRCGLNLLAIKNNQLEFISKVI